ncbi:MAG: hypothetical protein HUU17_02065 [Chthonomonadales bacterium]|nr:hypothetical protein [Chthonomonadales bacterium]
MVHSLVSIASVLTCLASSPSPASANTPVRYRWNKGETSRYRLVAKLNGSIPIIGNADPVDLEAVLTIVYRVKPIDVKETGEAAVDFRVETAEAEVLGLPLSIPMEDARKMLDRTVTFAATGEVLSIKEGPPSPFTLTVPGLDPQRLFSLICPIVFPDRPVQPGDEWDFPGRLVGSPEAPARFTARVQPTPKDTPSGGPEVRIAETFTMNIDQKLTDDKKPVTNGATPARSRTGTVTGKGVMVLDPEGGSLLRGQITIEAAIVERILGPVQPDERAETPSKVKAVVNIRPIPPTRGKPAG